MSPLAGLATEGGVEAPLDSVLSRPSASLLPRPGQFLSQAVGDVTIRVLRPQVKAFRGQRVDDPKEARAAEILLNEQSGAIAQARALVSRCPSQIAWSRLAQTLIAADKNEEAVEAARNALAGAEPPSADNVLSPDPVSTVVAAKVLLAAGLSEEAESFLARHGDTAAALALTYASIAENREDHEQALARLDGHIGTEISIFRGYLLLRVNKTREAIRELRRAGGEGSRNPDLLSNLGYAYAVAGSNNRALACTRQAVLLAPCSQRFSFNLVAHFVARARWSDALIELGRLRALFPNDLKIALATGSVYASAANTEKAIREYRRALSQNRLQRGSQDYSQIALNLAMIEWQIGKRTKEQVLSEVQTRIAQGQVNLPLAITVADLAPREVALKQAEEFYSVLRKSESDESLLALAVRLALLRNDFKSALLLAKRWVDDSPLNPDAVSQLIQILGHVFGEFSEAARVGKSALARLPGHDFIRNVTAFWLAFDGRCDEAQSVLNGIHDDRLPAVIATEGLIALGLGDLAGGLDLYDRAVIVARRRMGGGGQQFDDFERLARLYEWLGLERFELIADSEVMKRVQLKVPADWDADPSLRMVNQLAQKIGEPWPDEGHDVDS